jgi:hypothetical protein
MVWMPAALGDEPQQPRCAAARIHLDEKAPVSTHAGQITSQLFAVGNLPDDHRLFACHLRAAEVAAWESRRELPKHS